MTYEQLRSWIRQDLLELSARKFPNNPRLQMLYQIGFLQAQLAGAIRADNYVYHRFKSALERTEQWEKQL